MSEEIQKTEPKEERGLARINNYFEAPVVQKRFAEVMGERGAKQYVASVLIAVAESKTLQTCAPDSIYISALRAATLRLSVDNATGQAYLVPFKGRATLVVGYKGLYDMAIRTNKYRYINVAKVYEGEVVIEDRLTGLHTIQLENTNWNRDLSSKEGAHNRKTIGWIGAFEMTNGFKHTFYMTVEEIHAHAKEYSASYSNSASPWVKETAKMERKTVLRLMLRRWAPLDPTDTALLNVIENESNEMDVSDLPLIDDSGDRGNDAPATKTQEQNLKELGF